MRDIKSTIAGILVPLALANACGSATEPHDAHESKVAHDGTVDVPSPPTAAATATATATATAAETAAPPTPLPPTTAIVTASASAAPLPLQPPIPECAAYMTLMRTCPVFAHVMSPAQIAELDDNFRRYRPIERDAMAQACRTARSAAEQSCFGVHPERSAGPGHP